MRTVNNEKGAVLVFMTLMIVLLMVMVGMGLDTGQLTYTRSQGQAAVDAAALSAVSGLPLGAAQVTERVKAFNSNNDYLNSPNNAIDASKNLTYVSYDHATGAITDLPNISGANGVRVALEKTNPYTAVAAGTAMQSPVFLTPLMKLFGQSAPGTVDVSVSAVAAIRAVPSIPIAIMQSLCNANDVNDDKSNPYLLRQSNANVDNSCWTTYTDNPPSANRVQALFDASQGCSDLPQNTAILTPQVTQIELNNGQQASTYDAAAGLFLDPKNQTPTPAWWYVPIVPTTTKCNQQDTFLGWAKIQVSAVEKQGSPKYIQANVSCGQNDLWNTKNSLCFSSRLLRDTKSGM